jgi:hypothetical protein
MIGWVAFILAMMAIGGNPSQTKMDQIDARITRLERQKCTMIAVSTPSGNKTICALDFQP